MKKILLILCLGSFAFVSCGGATEEETTEDTNTDTTEVADNDEDIVDPNYLFIGDERGEYQLYGYEDIKTEHAVNLEDFTSDMAESNEFTGVVNITIDKVCKRAGCWITFNDTKGESVRVLFRDHFTIPTETPIGTQAIIAGHTMWDTLDVHAQAHFQSDETGEDESSIKGLEDSAVELVFDCDGILIAKQ
jgi:hypothetical protein